MSYKLRVGRASRKSRERTCESCGVCRGVCAARAGLVAFAEAFAQLALGLAAFAGAFAQPAQVLRRLPGRLRSPRKSCGVCRSVCAACASLAAFAGAFAQLALGLAAFAGAFAQPAQVLRRLPGRLRSPRKSCGVCRSVCAACASLAAFAGAFAQLALGLAALTEKRGGTSPQRAAPSLFSQIVGCLPSTLHPLPSIRTSRSACRPFR